MEERTVCVNALQIDMWIRTVTAMGHVPYIGIDVTRETPERPLIAPREYANSNQILVLNASPEAVGHFTYDLECGYLFVGAAFAGKRRDLSIPVEAVLYVKGRDTNMVHPLPDKLLVLPEGRQVGSVHQVEMQVQWAPKPKPLLRVVK